MTGLSDLQFTVLDTMDRSWKIARIPKSESGLTFEYRWIRGGSVSLPAKKGDQMPYIHGGTIRSLSRRGLIQQTTPRGSPSAIWQITVLGRSRAASFRRAHGR